jgi:hypothetical protein
VHHQGPLWGRQGRQLQPDQAVVLPEHQAVEGVGQARRRPLVDPPPDCPIRAARGGYPLLAGTMHQRRDYMLEHDGIRDAPAMAAQGVRRRDGGMEGQ